MLILIPQAFKKEAIKELEAEGYTYIEWDVPEPKMTPKELAAYEARRALPPYKKAKIPMSLRWEVWLRDDYTCKHCGKRTELSIDHIIAESKGGETAIDNLQTLCKLCNWKKGDR